MFLSFLFLDMPKKVVKSMLIKVLKKKKKNKTQFFFLATKCQPTKSNFIPLLLNLTLKNKNHLSIQDV